MQQPPVLPQAGPSVGPDGVLTYLGVDGLRHRVVLLPASEEATADRVMARVAMGRELFERIERLCLRWIHRVSGEELLESEALLLLLTTLETSLDDSCGGVDPEGEADPDPGA